jgi:hypothetical protein
MNPAGLIACGVLVVACVWAPQPARADQQIPCPTGSTAGGCGSQATPDAQTIPDPIAYTVSESVTPGGHVEPGATLTYTVSVHANADVPGAGFTDDLLTVLDDAQLLPIEQPAAGALERSAQALSWRGDLQAGQTARISYSVRVNMPDTGDGILLNDVAPAGGTGGECASCSVTNAVEGTFTVRQSATPHPGSAVHPGDTVRYTVDVAGGSAPVYASFAASLGPNADYAGDAHASDGIVKVRDNTVSWAEKLGAGATARVTFTAKVTAGGPGRVVSTVRPVSNDPYAGSCATDGACRVSYRVLAAPGPSSVPRTTTPPPGPSRSVSASAPTTSPPPQIADTGARVAGLGGLAVLLLLAGTGLLLLGIAPIGRARHRR